MWICFSDAFVSAVAISGDPEQLNVRARNREHLERLFPDLEIAETRHTDYRFRAFVGRRRFADLVAKRIAEIGYGNFKDSVKDQRLHDLYAAFWQLHFAYQHESP